MPIGDDADVAHAEHQRVGVGIDREHGARGAHAHHVVELAARADRHEESRRDRAAGDPDLTGARQPTGVGDLAGGAELRAERVDQRLQVVVLRRIDAAAHADHRAGFGERVEVVVARAGQHLHAVARGGGDRAHVGRVLGAWRRRRQHAHANRCELHW